VPCAAMETASVGQLAAALRISAIVLAPQRPAITSFSCKPRLAVRTLAEGDGRREERENSKADACRHVIQHRPIGWIWLAKSGPHGLEFGPAGYGPRCLFLTSL
jgi:hypothetical protein